MDKTKVDDMLIEMITPKVKQIEEKFGNGEGLSQDDINTLLLKSQYNHINHLDKKLDEVVQSVVDLEGKFTGLEGKFTGLEGKFTGLEGKFTALEGKFTALEGKFTALEGKFTLLENKFELQAQQIETTIQKALNKNMMLLITVMGVFVILSKLVDKI